MIEDGNVDDIIAVIMHADKKSVDATRKFAHLLQGKTDRDTLRRVYDFVRTNIRYQRDQAGHEVVKTPGCTINDGYGDCKSMSVLTGSLLRSLGFSFFYRVAYYEAATPEQGHIYTVVNLDGVEVVVDPVHHQFDTEEIYWSKQDYFGIKSASVGSISTSRLQILPWLGIAAALGIYLWTPSANGNE